jgi:hypothetical protein
MKLPIFPIKCLQLKIHYNLLSRNKNKNKIKMEQMLFINVVWQKYHPNGGYMI